MSNSTPKISSLGKIGEARLDLVPLLADCRPGIQPVEYNVVVAPARMPDKIGSLHVPDEYKDNQALAMQVGRIVSMSPLAFDYSKDWPPNTKPAPGQIVWFARYAGKEFEGIDGKTYRILKDKDIGAVIEEIPAPVLVNAGADSGNLMPLPFSVMGATSNPTMPKPFEFDSFPQKEAANG